MCLRTVLIRCLSSEPIKCLALALQSVHHVHRSNGLATGVFGVGDTVTDHILEKDLEDTAGLFVDQSRDTLDTTTASKSSNGGLGDPLNVVAQNLSVTLGAALSETLSSFSTARHDYLLLALL